MKSVIHGVLAFSCFCTAVTAQSVPSAEKLLPADTLAVFTIPDMELARGLYQQSPTLRLWSDPALKPFVDKFRSKLDAEVLQKFEKETGTSLGELFGLVKGQFTVAVTRNGWPASQGATPGILILADARDRSGRVKELLDQARQKLGKDGEAAKVERIDSTEFMVLQMQPPVPKAAPKDKAQNADGQSPDAAPESAPKSQPQDLYIGESGTLFIAGTSRSELEKVLQLKRGGAVLALSESTSFMPDYEAMFKGATAYGWFNVEPVISNLSGLISMGAPANPLGLNPGRIISTLGLSGLQTISMAGRLGAEGVTSEVQVRVPPDARRGLVRVFEFDAKDSSPPSFVPANALSFSRTRIDLMRAWNTLEAMVVDTSPQLGGIVKMTVDSIGKDKDSSFDFRKQFLANLGDDLITWQMPPPAGVLTGNQPQIALISSPKPDELAASLTLLMGMIPPDVAKLQESEVNGVKVHSISLPMGMAKGGQGAPPATQNFSFTSAKGYLVLATDPGLMKNFLEGNTGSAGPLASQPDLEVAAKMVDGFGTGMFGYANNRENLRVIWDAFTQGDSATGNPVALMWHQLVTASAAAGKGGGVGEWIDLSLLPPFEKVEKYFYISVYSGATNAKGFTLKGFSPNPPGM